MHVISMPALKAFWLKHKKATKPLQDWYSTMESTDFNDLSNLKDTFGSADYVQPKFTVFNIGGNKYRLIAVIHYNRHKVYIRAVLTHREYDKVDWSKL